MYMDFAGLLFVLMIITGAVAIFGKLFKKQNKFIEFMAGLFPVFFIVFFIRTFAGEPYRIPSGSMKPTLLVGDFVLVNKFAYGWYFPYIDKRLTLGQDIKRGDVIVFRYPPKPTMNFVKRVIGLPGDKILYVDHELYINGNHVPKTYLDSKTTQSSEGGNYLVREFSEDLPPDIKHFIYERPIKGLSFEGVVPDNQYFVMGDNRDDSGDSRVWGFVPNHYVKGKASYVLLSLDTDNWTLRFNRIGAHIE